MRLRFRKRGVNMCKVLTELEGYDVAFAEDEAFEMYMDAVKSDVAYCLGIEEYSDEWYELMDI